MDQDIAILARDIAAELSEIDAGLPAKVEAEIQTWGQRTDNQQFDGGATAIALASLVLNVAMFAYQIHRDRQQDKKLAPDVLKRRLRAELDERDYPDTAQRASVIEAAVRIVESQR